MRESVKSVKNILLLPIWVLSVFTTAKFFGNNPIIGSKTLNILGLHVFRMV
ncbi:MAG: phytanoyl-CoA dioxygenase, partial [Alphaproteobacteria bacterium CG11_big_fil_rev_8_21_14_0_20_44_7]